MSWFLRLFLSIFVCRWRSGKTSMTVPVHRTWTSLASGVRTRHRYKNSSSYDVCVLIKWCPPCNSISLTTWVISSLNPRPLTSLSVMLTQRISPHWYLYYHRGLTQWRFSLNLLKKKVSQVVKGVFFCLHDSYGAYCIVVVCLKVFCPFVSLVVFWYFIVCVMINLIKKIWVIFLYFCL